MWTFAGDFLMIALEPALSRDLNGRVPIILLVQPRNSL